MQAALDRELVGVTFQPQILTRSRAIARVQDRVLSALTDSVPLGHHSDTVTPLLVVLVEVLLPLALALLA